jgi:hypothetical protein
MTHFLDLTTLSSELLACYEAEAAIEQQRRDAHNNEAARYSGVRPDYAGVDTFIPRQPATLLGLARKRLADRQAADALPVNRLMVDVARVRAATAQAYEQAERASQGISRGVETNRRAVQDALLLAQASITNAMMAVLDAQVTLSDVEETDEPAFAAIARNIIADLNPMSAGIVR